jgi:NTE family protein
VLSPAEIDVNPSDFDSKHQGPLFKRPFNDTLVLSDGGVYDNLGLETAWKRYQTILVSDGGGQMAPEESPAGDWAQHSKRILDIVDNQVRSLRKRQLMDSYKSKAEDANHRTGTYWGIRSDIQDYQLPDSLSADHELTKLLADIDTRLKRMSVETQNQLMNWGYAVCDAAVRKHTPQFIASGSPAAKFPFPGGVG